MSNNWDYKKIFNLLQKRHQTMNLPEIVGALYMENLEKEYFKLFPRRKKFVYKNLPGDVQFSIRTKWVNIFTELFSRHQRVDKMLEKMLNEKSETTEIIPGETWNKLFKRSGGDFWSQGYGANIYAEASVKETQEILTRNGIESRITKSLFYKTSDGMEDWEFYLEAPLEPWQYDCVIRKTPWDLYSWAVSCWKRNVNPKVYLPMMDFDIWERSMEESMKGKR